MTLAGFVRQHVVWLLPLVLWSLVWKGLALWRAARLRETAWFVVMLIINTAGILEIIYLLSKPNPDKQ